jgi:hypothetical protein
MSKLRVSRIGQIVVLLVACVLSAMVGFTLQGVRLKIAKADTSLLQQQSDEKVIERREFPNEPFDFGNLSVKKAKIALRQKLNATSLAENGGGRVEDWLENLEFSLKNKSDKQITYIDIDLSFPETGASGASMVYDLDVGIHPKAIGDAKRYGKPLALNPGDTFTLTLSAKKLEMIKNFLSLGGYQLATLNSAVIRIAYIYFEDGMMWGQGSWYKPDANAPGGYERVSQQSN